MIPVKGEPLGVVSNWPPALQAALARWGATQAKSPALTALDITGKPLYTLTYGKMFRLAQVFFECFNGIVHQKLMVSLFTHPHAIQNPYATIFIICLRLSPIDLCR